MPDSYAKDGVVVEGPITSYVTTFMFGLLVLIGFLIYKVIVYKEEKKIEEKQKTK